MTRFYEAFSAALTCWGQALLLEALLKAEENDDLRFPPQRRAPVDESSYDEPRIGADQMAYILREIPLFIIFTGFF